MIRVTSKQDGFRRCGVAFSKQPTDFPNSAFDKDQLETLQKEPMLVVELVEKAPPAKKDDKKDDKK